MGKRHFAKLFEFKMCFGWISHIGQGPSGLILGLRLANERRRYKVTLAGCKPRISPAPGLKPDTACKLGKQQLTRRLWLAIPAITMVLLRVLKYVTRYVCEVTRYVIHVTRNLNYVTRFLS